MSVKDELRDAQNPPVTCPRGHAYRVPRRFMQRSVRKHRTLVCPKCLTFFKVDGC